MNKVLKELIVAQFREYWRAPEVLFWTLGFPIMIAGVLGLLYSFKPTVNYKVAFIVEAESAPAGTEGMFEKPLSLPGRGIRNVSFEKMTREKAEEAFRSGKVEIILRVRADSSASSSIEYLFDPVSERAESIYLWVDHLVHEKAPNVKSTVVTMDQRGSRYIDRLIPGLIALGIMNSTLWGIGWTLIEFRIKKFLRRMIVTPMRKFDFMLSISTVRMSLSMIETGILFLFARYVFDVRFQGKFYLFAMIFLAGHVAFSGLSILLASRTNNTRVGNGLINIVTMPMFLLSGVFFSYHSFPDWMVAIIQFLPLTVLVDSLRDIFLYNADFLAVIFPVTYLFTFGLVLYLLGLKMYRWY